MTELDGDFLHFLESLKEASKRIEKHYFQLEVFGHEEPIYRERVYCYELYHQLRCVLGNTFPYKLDGEVDKVGHRIYTELNARKPDIIFHVPGERDWNLVVIEVKNVSVERSALKGDLNKLQLFLEKADYHWALMLIYGDGNSHLPDFITSEMENISPNYRERILLAWHQGPGDPIEIIKYN